jgi:pilus assembly protein CpaF
MYNTRTEKASAREKKALAAAAYVVGELQLKSGRCGRMTEAKRFSALDYSSQFRGKNNNPNALQDFKACVVDVRNYLVSLQGKTEEDKQQYSESLNRAILGYESERARFLAIINDYLAKKRIDLAPLNEKYNNLAESIFAEVIGLNVLELILKARDGLEEIQVVGKQIYEVRNGTAVVSEHAFQSIKEVERIQQNLVLFNNDTINPRKRWAEVMLKDGSRVTLTGFGFTAEPTLTMRFYTMKHFALDTLTRPEYATLNGIMVDIIRCVLSSYFNMVVIGPTNSGKTNLIKAFISEMPDQERIITIESRFELMLKRDFTQKNIIEYEVSEDDPFHSGHQAFKLALRQSPKRICCAEIREHDANIYVRACTRGHEGSITSVHVNELEDVPDAITDMCLMDGRGTDPKRLRKRITEYVTQIGFEMGIVDGQRKLVRIGEYQFFNGEVKVNDIVRYDYIAKQWICSDKFSKQAARKIMRHSPEAYKKMVEMKLIDTMEAEA